MIGKVFKIILVCIFIVGSIGTADAAILWAGGEDVDFPAGDLSPNICTSARCYRAGYSRHGLWPRSAGAIYRSNPFPGGAVTTAWASARVSIYQNYTSIRFFGLGKSGTGNSLWVGSSAASGTQLAIYSYDGTTWTLIAAETGNSLTMSAVNKIDFHVQNYGAAGTVSIYTNAQSTAALTYTGNIQVGASTDLDDLRWTGVTNSDWLSQSEFVVANSDTRLMSVVTHAPNAAGTASTWTGAYTDVDEALINDADAVSSATTGQNFQCNLTDLPAGTFSVAGVKIIARSSTVGSGVASIAPGIYTNSTVSVPASTALTNSWSILETLYNNNPVTAAPFTQAESNALQINLQSAP